MVITTAAVVTTCVKATVGVIAYATGFAPIPANSIAASIMSVAWKTRVGIPAVSFLQSSAAMVANAVAAIL